MLDAIPLPSDAGSHARTGRSLSSLPSLLQRLLAALVAAIRTIVLGSSRLLDFGNTLHLYTGYSARLTPAQRAYVAEYLEWKAVAHDLQAVILEAPDAMERGVAPR